jgi:peptidylprolyl isomerase
MRSKLLTPLLALALGALVLSACGDDDSEATAADEGGSEEAAAIDTSTKPEIVVPTEAAPEQLVTEDLVEGTGATAEPGSLVTVQYVGVDYETGEQFDASWDRGEPFSFQLGQGQVIAGWDDGFEGMKVGGRRELIIPAEQAYGSQGSPPAIGPDATLIFVVDLLDVG